jgi:hypothetical protein
MANQIVLFEVIRSSLEAKNCLACSACPLWLRKAFPSFVLRRSRAGKTLSTGQTLSTGRDLDDKLSRCHLLTRAGSSRNIGLSVKLAVRNWLIVHWESIRKVSHASAPDLNQRAVLQGDDAAAAVLAIILVRRAGG